jgi:stage II sporulation protein M
MPERHIPRYVVFLSAFFFAVFLTGFLAPIPGKLDLLGTLMEAFEPFLTLPPWKMFFVILLNNSAKTFVALVLGILFGILPLIAVATNGYILGIVYLFVSGKVGYVQAAKSVLPHGVLEIPAVILSAAYGLWLGVTFGKRILRAEADGCPAGELTYP